MTNQSNSTEFPPEQYPYRIRNWKKYQHYKKRNPPWVKLHTSIFASDDWASLPDNSKLVMVICIMVASKFEGHLPKSCGVIQRFAYLRRKVNLKPLIDCGFLVKTQADASIALANARPETEHIERAETETEHKVSIDASPPAQPQERGQPRKKGEKQGHRLPEDWMPDAKGQAFAVARFGDEGAHEEYDSFRDYWLAKPGKEGRKLDWDRTWMNWCRNSRRNGNGMKSFTGNGHDRPKTLKERTADALQRLGSGSLSEIVDLGLPKLGPD